MANYPVIYPEGWAKLPPQDRPGQRTEPQGQWPVGGGVFVELDTRQLPGSLMHGPTELPAPHDLFRMLQALQQLQPSSDIRTEEQMSALYRALLEGGR